MALFITVIIIIIIDISLINIIISPSHYTNYIYAFLCLIFISFLSFFLAVHCLFISFTLHSYLQHYNVNKLILLVLCYIDHISSHYRSSHHRCSVRKGVLRSFAKFTGKHLCQILFFNKVAGLTPATLLKKRLWHRCFLVNFCEISKNTFFTKHLRATASAIRMLLIIFLYARLT